MGGGVWVGGGLGRGGRWIIWDREGFWGRGGGGGGGFSCWEVVQAEFNAFQPRRTLWQRAFSSLNGCIYFFFFLIDLFRRSDRES